jgi:Arc/MetJ-type ribon-helix-helix transcriptional regulator
MDVLALEIEAETQDWINHRLNEGRYLDAAEYLRELIRRDMTVNDGSGVGEAAVTESQ